MVITIDGPVAAGKTTVAQKLASRLGWRLLDTGAIYRCLALEARQRGIDWTDEAALAELAGTLALEFRPAEDGQRVWLGGVDVSARIRSSEISRGASIVAALPAVRSALLPLQRRLAAGCSVVAEGRDTGTVVFPDADAKFYLYAAAEERAERRHLQLGRAGVREPLARILADLGDRDRRDAGRCVAPLAPAPDAVLIDTTELTVAEVVAAILERLPAPTPGTSGAPE